MTSMGLLRLDWRKKKVNEKMSKAKLKVGMHAGKFGMIKVSRNPANGFAGVVGWIISPTTEKQIRVERWFYRDGDANLYVDYVQQGSGVFNQNTLKTGRLFRQVKTIVAGYDLKRSNGCWIVTKSEEMIGSIEKHSDTDLCETWLAYDAVGTEIGRAMGKQQALSAIAIHYINLI